MRATLCVLGAVLGLGCAGTVGPDDASAESHRRAAARERQLAQGTL